ncbi:hypothetical protein [Streptomyces sp. NPDC059262]|uniref:hypothetical protein n=1 Tax=Streptomyces sp. NPDC059262 TaxID=3346797 RepID=UPI0036C2560D
MRRRTVCTWTSRRRAIASSQVAPDGKGGAQRVSCNRGDRVYPAADEGQRVLWLDGTTGYTNLVKRDRPAGNC